MFRLPTLTFFSVLKFIIIISSCHVYISSLILDLNNSSYNHAYSANSSFSNSNFGDDDDHTEASRTVSPSQRFDPFRSSTENYYKSTNVNNESPIDKIRRISKGAWGYFSRPLHSSTPCVDVI